MLSLKPVSGLLPRFRLARTPILPALSFCSEMSNSVQLGALRPTTEAAAAQSPDNLLDSQRREAEHHNRRVDITNGHLTKFGATPFTHQLVLGRLAAHIGNEGYTICFNASVQYGRDNLRSHDISVWQEDASTICESMVVNSDTWVDGVRAPPYVVIEVISSKMGQKDELEIKHLCTAKGVEYLWLVHPDEGRIEAHALQQGKTWGKNSIRDHLIWPGSMHTIPPFSELNLNLMEIFEHLDCEMYH